MENYQLGFLLTLSVQIIVSIVILFRQGYFHKKGQNKADKEDIFELTKIVESVKAEFIRENAKINSDLDILKDRRVRTYTQAQQAIINFHSDFNILFFYMAYTKAYQYETGPINDRLTKIQELRYKVDVSLNLMDLLVESKDTIQMAYHLRSECIALLNSVEVFLGHLEAQVDFKNKVLIIQSGEAFHTVKQEEKKKIEDRIALADQAIRELQNAFHPEVLKIIKNIRPIQEAFAEKAKSFLLS
jgi:hypothetical protein